MTETLLKSSDSEDFSALQALNVQVVQGTVDRTVLQTAGRSLIDQFDRFVAMPKAGDSLVSPLELCICIIHAAGLFGEITEKLVVLASEAPLPGDRAAALEALKDLDEVALESLVTERLQEETSNLVRIVLVELAGERRLRSTVFCVQAVARNNDSAPTVDGLLRDTCREVLTQLRALSQAA